MLIKIIFKNSINWVAWRYFPTSNFSCNIY